MSRPLPQPLQAEISRKAVKTVPLKLSEYLDKNAFYNDEEQRIEFSLNCCTILLTIRDQLSRIFYTENGGTLSPMHKRLKFLGCTTGPLRLSVRRRVGRILIYY